MIRAAIPAYLLSVDAVTDVVGSRIYPARVPQTNEEPDRAEPYPCVVFRKAPRPFGAAYGNDGTAGHAKSYVRVDNLARSYTAAQQLAAVTRAALEAHSGKMGDLDVAEVQVIDDFDDDDTEAGGGDEAAFSSVLILEVLHASEVSDES